MFYGQCTPGNWGFPGSLGVWGWTGLMVYLVLLIGLLGILALAVLRAARRAQGQTGPVRHDAGQPTAKEILQARYARSEITREQSERMKQDIG